MYHPPPPKEPSGCIQSLLISKAMLQIMFAPLALIMGSILAVLFTLDALSYSPFLGLGMLIFWVLVLVAFGKWGWRRTGNDDPDDHDYRTR